MDKTLIIVVLLIGIGSVGAGYGISVAASGYRNTMEDDWVPLVTGTDEIESFLETSMPYPLIAEYENNELVENAVAYFAFDEPDNISNFVSIAMEATDADGRADGILYAPDRQSRVFVLVVKDNLCGYGWVDTRGTVCAFIGEEKIENERIETETVTIWCIFPITYERDVRHPARFNQWVSEGRVAVRWDEVDRIVLNEPVPWRVEDVA